MFDEVNTTILGLIQRGGGRPGIPPSLSPPLEICCQVLIFSFLVIISNEIVPDDRITFLYSSRSNTGTLNCIWLPGALPLEPTGGAISAPRLPAWQCEYFWILVRADFPPLIKILYKTLPSVDITGHIILHPIVASLLKKIMTQIYSLYRKPSRKLVEFCPNSKEYYNYFPAFDKNFK